MGHGIKVRGDEFAALYTHTHTHTHLYVDAQLGVLDLVVVNEDVCVCVYIS